MVGQGRTGQGWPLLRPAKFAAVLPGSVTSLIRQVGKFGGVLRFVKFERREGKLGKWGARGGEGGGGEGPRQGS